MKTDIEEETRLVKHIAAYYDRVAPGYATRLMSGESSELGRNYKAIVKLLDPYHFTSEQYCLDVGTGGGFPGMFMATQMPTIGVDVSRQMLQHYRTLTQRNLVTGLLQLGMMDGRMLGFQRETFDLVTCIGLFEYVANLQPFFEAAYYVLKPGGLYLFDFFNKHYIQARTGAPFPRAVHNPFHVFRVLREEGFVVLDYMAVRQQRDLFTLARKKTEVKAIG